MESTYQDDTERQQQYYLLETLRKNPPGPPTDNRWTQANQFVGVPYVAIRTICDAMQAATVKVTRFKNRKRKKRLAPLRIKKGVVTAHTQADNGDYVPVEFDHPLSELFRRINKQDTFSDFLTDWIIQESLFGSAKIWTPMMRGWNKPSELWVLPEPFLTYQPVTKERPYGSWLLTQMMPTMYGFAPTGQGYSCYIDGREILVSRRRHHLFRWDGYSPFTAVARQIDALNSIEEARKASMDNEIDPSLLLALKNANPTELARIANELSNRHGGAERRKKIMAYAAESMDVNFPTRAAREMDYTSSYDQATKFAMAAFGVPPTVAQISEAGSYAQLYASRLQFYEGTIKTMAKRFSDILTKKLAHEFYGEEYSIEIEVPRPNNEESDSTRRISRLQAGTITVNEDRLAENQDPFEDGDVPLFEFQAKRQQAAGGGPGGGQDPMAAMMGGGGGGAPPDPMAPPENEEGEGSLNPQQAMPALEPVDGPSEEDIQAVAKSFFKSLKRKSRR